MGAWGEGAFDNDAAWDWACELEEADDLSLVESTLADFEASAADDEDMDLSCCALAACEVVAMLRENIGDEDSYPEPVEQWVIAHPIDPPPALVERCTSVIDRIVAGSTLGQNFQAIGPVWRETMRDLRTRVGG
jgi:Domain of unknown function (DUF4259)